MKFCRTWLVFVFSLVVLGLVIAQPPKPPGKPDDKKDSKKDDKAGKKDDKPAAPKPAEAAKPPASPFKDIQLAKAEDELTKQEQNELRRIVNAGPEAPSADARKQLLEKASRWYVYRLTSNDVQEGREGTVSQLMDEFIGSDTKRSEYFPTMSRGAAPDAEELARRKRQETYLKTVLPIVVADVRKAMVSDMLIARLNAMRVLHKFADYGPFAQQEVAEEFVKAIENPFEHDAVRLWALKGIGALFTAQQDPQVRLNLSPARAERCGLAVCQWLGARCKMDPSVVAQMSEDEREGISYVRREAIRALGNSRRPLIKDMKEGRDGPVAQLLIFILSQDENNMPAPAPTWLEQVEAAYALCQLQVRLSPSYQPDFAAHQLARFLAALGSTAVDNEKRDRQRWKFFGFHLRNGLDLLKADVPNERGGAYVKQAIGQMDGVIENLLDSSKYNQAAQDLNNWVNRTPPKATAVYNPPL